MDPSVGYGARRDPLYLMLRFLKRWLPLSSRPERAPAEGLEALGRWAAGNGLTLRVLASAEGGIIEGRTGPAPWRLEWGPPQRRYIEGFEVRWRAELDGTGDLQALILNRLLQERMEREVFEEYVDGVQTQLEDDTPPEMRWLVLFPKLGAAEMGALRESHAATANLKAWLLSWLNGPLSAALASTDLPPAQPLVLTLGRGRLTLRTAMPQPDDAQLDMLHRLFETALREARRVAADAVAAQMASTQPSLWSASGPPHPEPPSGPERR